MKRASYTPLIILMMMLYMSITAHAAPVQSSTPITGEVETITISDKNSVWSVGTMTVGGQVIIIPSNLLINLPNDYQSLQQLFVNAPPECQSTGETGLAKADRCNARATGAQVTILANRTDSGNVIAGQVDIFKAVESVTGTITYINSANGYFRVNGISGDSATGTMVRVNDPPVGAPAGLGRHTVQSGPGCRTGNTDNCSADTRFKIDPDNYTFAFITGYPACIPRNGNDANCPATNRPAAVPINTLNPVPPPPVAADSRRFAPIQLGDGIKADGNFETIGGVTFLSASSVRIFVDLTTNTTGDTTQPDYLIITEAGWDGPAYHQARVRGRLLTNSTYHSPVGALGVNTDIDYFSIHYDPKNNLPHEQILYSTQFNKQQGAVVFNAPTGVFDSQIRMGFLTGGKVLGDEPCLALRSGVATDKKFLGGPPVIPEVSAAQIAAYCRNATAVDGSTTDFFDNFNLMVPVFREVMARSVRRSVVTKTLVDRNGVQTAAIDINNRAAQSMQYKLPPAISYGAFEDANLGLMPFPVPFSGNPWLMDRRLSPNGCVGACETSAQPLTPFPFEGIDPRTISPTFGAAAVAGGPLMTLPNPNRMFNFMVENPPNSGTFTMTGALTWPPTNAPAFPINPVATFSLFPPLADEDAATTLVGTPVIINVLANDVAAFGTIDTASVRLPPSSGILEILGSGATVQANPNGTITYTPAPNFSGTDTFTYTVANNYGSVSLPGTVTVTVARKPVAVDDAISIPANTTASINVVANDTPGTSLINLGSVNIVSSPNATCGSLVNQVDGIVIFTTTSVTGPCTFSYTVSDVSIPALISNVSNVTVTVTPPLPPVAVNDSATVTAGSTTVIDVTANDTSAVSTINKATLSVSAATGGSAVANLDGTVSYTAPATAGSYSFTYTVKDNAATPVTSNVATVLLTVTQISPITPTQVSPSGTVLVANDPFVFSAVTGATGYYVYHVDPSGAGVRSALLTPAQAGCPTNTGNCSVSFNVPFATGDQYWKVVAVNTAGVGTWSANMFFNVITAPPATPTQVGPNGAGTSPTASFFFTAVAGASGYYIYHVDPLGAGTRSALVTPAQANCPTNTGNCSITFDVPFAAGTHYWKVAANNVLGLSAWSANMFFDVGAAPATPTQVSPSGAGASPTVPFVFSAVAGATGYYIYHVDPLGAGARSTLLTPAQAGCPTNTGDCSVTFDVPFATGAHYWKVAADNAAGLSPWSASMGFSLP